MAAFRNLASSDSRIAGRRPVGGGVLIATLLLGIVLVILNKIGVPNIIGALAVVAVFAAATLHAGLGAGSEYVSDWLYSGNKASPGVIGMVVAAGVLSGPLMISATGLFMSGNLLGPVILVALFSGIALFSFLVAPFLRNSGSVSPAVFIALRFGHAWLRVLATIAVLSIGIMLLWAQMRSGILLGRVYFGMSGASSAAIFALMIGATILPGGQYGVMRTNLILYAIIAIAVFLPLIWLCIQAGTLPVPQVSAGVAAMRDIENLESRLRELGLPVFWQDMETGWPILVNASGIVVTLVVLTVGFIALPAMLGGFQASRSSPAARSSGMYALIFAAVIITAAPAAAAFAKLGVYESMMGLTVAEIEANLDWVDSWRALPSLFSQQIPLISFCNAQIGQARTLVEACGGDPGFPIGPAELRMHGELPTLAMAQLTRLPGVLFMLAAAGLFAAALSTANATAFMAAVTISDGLQAPSKTAGRPANQRLFLLRSAGVAAIAVAAILAAASEISPVELTLWALGACAAFAPLLIATVWSNRITAYGMMAGLVVTLAVVALLPLVFVSGHLGWTTGAVELFTFVPPSMVFGLAGLLGSTACLVVSAYFHRRDETEEALSRIRFPRDDPSADHLR